MANDKQSLVNYETILWLWDASDKDRVSFLASLLPKQREQFCEVLRDVLNNPWDERSAIRLTKLNKLLGQNVERIKKQVQFSGDKTPELDESQIFRLFHDYTVLNHDGTRDLSDLGRESLRQLLITVSAEFETYYNVDPKHPQLIWDGFQNDTQFPVEGMEKTKVEPSDYGELNAKITNYFFPVGGGPRPRPADDEREEDYHEEEYYNPPHDEVSSESFWGMTLRYAPLFLTYLLTALCADSTGMNGLWTVVGGLASLFASVRWYHSFKFRDRAWASLMQGFWILYFALGVTLAGISPLVTWMHLTWPIFAFPLVHRAIHEKTPTASKFRIAGVVMLAVMFGVAIYRDQIGYRQVGRRQIEQKLHHYQQKLDETPNINHYNQLKSQPAGLCWRNLKPCDVTFLTPDDINTLRLQFSSVLTRKARGVKIDAFSGLRPILLEGGRQGWQADMKFNCPIYTVCNAYSQSAQALKLIISSVKYYRINYQRGDVVPMKFIVSDDSYYVEISGPFDKLPGASMYFGPGIDSLVSDGGTLLIGKGSELDSTLSAMDAMVRKWTVEMASDKLIKDADESAARRYRFDDDMLRRCQQELIRMARMRKVHDEPTDILRSLSEGIVPGSNAVGSNGQRVAMPQVNSLPIANTAAVVEKKVIASGSSDSHAVVTPMVTAPSATTSTETSPVPMTSAAPTARRHAAPAPVALKNCRSCRGTGQAVEHVRCQTCNGARRIDDPAANAVAAAANIANLVTGAKRRPVKAKKIQCPTCSGAGRIKTVVPCNRCGGTGKQR